MSTRLSHSPIRVSFIYVNYNASKLIQEAISSVIEAAAFTIYEIIVVDDVSTDDSVQMIKTKFPSVRLIVNSTTLWSDESLNKAITASQGEFVYTFGTDTVLNKGTLEKLLSFMDENKNVHVVTCKTFFPDGRFQQNACRKLNLKLAFLSFTFLGHLFPSWKQKVSEDYNYKGWNWNENHEIESTGFSNALVRRSALDSVGLTDTGFKQYFSENDLCLRIRKKGGKIYYLAEGNVIHHLRGTVSNSNIKQIAKNYEQDCFHYFHKYYGFWIALLLKIFILMSNFLLSIKNMKPVRVFSRFLSNPKNN